MPVLITGWEVWIRSDAELIGRLCNPRVSKLWSTECPISVSPVFTFGKDPPLDLWHKGWHFHWELCFLSVSNRHCNWKRCWNRGTPVCRDQLGYCPHDQVTEIKITVEEIVGRSFGCSKLGFSGGLNQKILWVARVWAEDRAAFTNWFLTLWLHHFIMISSFLVALNEIQRHYPELKLYPSSNFELGWFKGIILL